MYIRAYVYFAGLSSGGDPSRERRERKESLWSNDVGAMIFIGFAFSRFSVFLLASAA